MQDLNIVMARLVGTYDLSPADTKDDVQQVDYLCVYEYEYEGTIYQYRRRQRDNFTPVPEELELGFHDDPGKAFPIKKPEDAASSPSSSSSKNTFLIFAVLGILFLLYCLKMLAEAFLDAPYIVAALVVLCVVIAAMAARKRSTEQTHNEALEEALLSGHSVTAYLVKTTSVRVRNYSRQDDRMYRGKYAYKYNGREYKASFLFSSTPPKSLRLFFKDNPRKVFFK